MTAADERSLDPDRLACGIMLRCSHDPHLLVGDCDASSLPAPAHAPGTSCLCLATPVAFPGCRLCLVAYNETLLMVRCQ